MKFFRWIRCFYKYSWRIFAVLLAAFGSGCQARGNIPASPVADVSPLVTVASQQKYEVHQVLTLEQQGPGQPEKQNLWVALIRDFAPYQEVTALEISPEYELIVDEYGNQYAEFDFSGQPAGTTRTVQIDYQVVVNELTYDLSACEGDLLDEFVQPELHIESANAQIVTLARDLSQGAKTICQQVRAFYDYLGDELVHTENGKNWGAQAALGPMGADCTEYSALLVALSRSQGIPARYFEGLLFPDSTTEAAVRYEHAWPDVYLPGAGWVSLDPTLGRSPFDRETYFAHHTPGHLIVTVGPNPSTLRGSSYWTHLYWPGDSAQIRVKTDGWIIKPVEE